MNKIKGKVVSFFGKVPFKKGDMVVVDLENGIPEYGLKIDNHNESKKIIKLIGNGNVLKIKY
jgi:hypothetical protein